MHVVSGKAKRVRRDRQMTDKVIPLWCFASLVPHKWPWPSNILRDKDHVHIDVNQCTKFEVCRVKHSPVIGCTSFGRPALFLATDMCKAIPVCPSFFEGGIILEFNENSGTFRGMHMSPLKHSYTWLQRKCDYRTDRRTDRRRTKWSLCAAMLCRRHKK